MATAGNPLDTILQMLRQPQSGGPPTPLDPSQQVPSSSPQQVPNPSQQAPPMPDTSQLSGQNLARPMAEGLPPNPAPTKAHKLLQILQGGLIGGLSGLAANAQTYAATGRNAGFGGGVGAAFTQSLPFVRQLQGQQLERGGLENQLLKGAVQFDPYQRYLAMLKGGAEISKDQAEAARAPYQTPKGGGVYDTRTGKFAPGTEPQDKSQSVDNLIAAAAQKALNEGRDPSQDEAVQRLSDVKSALQSAQPKTQNDFEQFYAKYLRDNKLPDTASNMQRAHQQFEVKPVQPGAGDARLDRSYQFNSTQLEKLGQPIDEGVRRMGRLQDTLNQGTPQADALLAPEMLTVMAGGQGSGLRMNEAEIARIVGGRSNWESLQASFNKWKLDPTTANSITPAQRQQMRALADMVEQKLRAKQDALDDAHHAMVNASDVKEHRQILADARSKITGVDRGGGQTGASGVTVTDPQGGSHVFPDQASAEKFKKLAGIQ